MFVVKNRVVNAEVGEALSSQTGQRQRNITHMSIVSLTDKDGENPFLRQKWTEERYLDS